MGWNWSPLESLVWMGSAIPWSNPHHAHRAVEICVNRRQNIFEGSEAGNTWQSRIGYELSDDEENWVKNKVLERSGAWQTG